MSIAEPPPGPPLYRPRGRIRDLWAYQGREVLVAGPAGTGKSLGALRKLDMCARRFPGIRGLITRKLRTTLTQAALVTFNSKVLLEGEAERMFHHGDQEYRYPNGSVVAVAGLDDPEKAKSSEYDLVYVQEATELEEADWSMLLRGLRNHVMPYQQLLADCNPASPHHWLKQRCDIGVCHLIESLHQDNPILWDSMRGDWTVFGQEYIAGLDSLQGYLYQRLRLGLWVAAQGAYFTELNPDQHYITAYDPPLEWPRWIAVDYGFAAPFCALWFAREPETRQIVVYREVYSAGLRDEQQAELILERSSGETIQQLVLDPSMFNPRTEQQRPSIAQVYAARGLQAMVKQGIFPGQNSRKQGWAVVRRALAWDADRRPRVQLMRERCPNLLRELPALVHDPLDPEDVADKINSVAVSDHATDAFRYGLCAEALPPRQDPRALLFGGR